MPERLVNQSGLAKLLGVSPNTLVNWRNRGTEPILPEPFAFAAGSHGRQPLWSVAQCREIVLAKLADIEARAAEVLGDDWRDE